MAHQSKTSSISNINILHDWVLRILQKKYCKSLKNSPQKNKHQKNTNQYGTNTRTDQNESFSKLKRQTGNGDMGDSS